MPQHINMVGKRFGRLVGVSLVARTKHYGFRWLFQCDCGKQREADGSNVRSGYTTSCGCFRNERIVECNGTHRMSGNSEYTIWHNMKARCFNVNNDHFQYYGGRGITVCAEWRDSFEQFYADMGPRPQGLTIERKDNSLGYSKNNCVWATATTQARNSRRVVMSVELAREAKCVRDSGGNLAAWARANKIRNDTAWLAATGKTWKELATAKQD